jgi:hypothetical protein
LLAARFMKIGAQVCRYETVSTAKYSCIAMPDALKWQ